MCPESIVTGAWWSGVGLRARRGTIADSPSLSTRPCSQSRLLHQVHVDLAAFLVRDEGQPRAVREAKVVAGVVAEGRALQRRFGQRDFGYELKLRFLADREPSWRCRKHVEGLVQAVCWDRFLPDFGHVGPGAFRLGAPVQLHVVHEGREEGQQREERTRLHRPEVCSGSRFRCGASLSSQPAPPVRFLLMGTAGADRTRAASDKPRRRSSGDATGARAAMARDTDLTCSEMEVGGQRSVG